MRMVEHVSPLGGKVCIYIYIYDVHTLIDHAQHQSRVSILSRHSTSILDLLKFYEIWMCAA
jgi:hypothetical protein